MRSMACSGCGVRLWHFYGPVNLAHRLALIGGFCILNVTFGRVRMKGREILALLCVCNARQVGKEMDQMLVRSRSFVFVC